MQTADVFRRFKYTSYYFYYQVNWSEKVCTLITLSGLQSAVFLAWKSQKCKLKKCLKGSQIQLCKVYLSHANCRKTCGR